MSGKQAVLAIVRYTQHSWRYRVCSPDVLRQAKIASGLALAVGASMVSAATRPCECCQSTAKSLEQALKEAASELPEEFR